MTYYWHEMGLAKNIGLLGATILVCLILGEVCVRIFIPQQLIVPNHHIWRPDETVGWRHVENASTQINNGEGLVRFATDSNGYRINFPPDGDRTPAHDVAILTLGDSFLEALSVENRHTIPQVIGRELNRRYQKTVLAVNDGVGGWGPNQYLKEASIALSKKAYDLGIVFLYAANDIVHQRENNFSPAIISAQHHFRIPGSLHWNELIDAIFYPINDNLETCSHMFVLFKKSFKTLLARVGLTAAYFPRIFNVHQKESASWQITTEICQDISRVFTDHDTPVLFVFLPAKYQVYEEDFYEHLRMFSSEKDSVDIEQPNRILADLFRANSLHLVDPLSRLRAVAGEGKELYGNIDVHLNREGHRIVAEFILPVVEEYLRDELSAEVESLILQYSLTCIASSGD